ncbi:hypothetical protein ASPZODRAFT_133371 [Penicilliopsis zonata CBS 506.65]|uniref:Uncharacterized protein n=1 Tax=Penicilliopsis zonata CBS 506.65 TaxID=1073090 RepID=A0A1L9SEA9_9EURO|nr:hypothetical protein ASPZODRAFT_133371 [Penicilliopsis zonata CBS 506.65]OJJ45546.1 hypothetical protein ASPZODRAFT_133371 [Penicilliopsis zonata CBS 506.65]
MRERVSSHWSRTASRGVRHPGTKGTCMPLLFYSTSLSHRSFPLTQNLPLSAWSTQPAQKLDGLGPRQQSKTLQALQMACVCPVFDAGDGCHPLVRCMFGLLRRGSSWGRRRIIRRGYRYLCVCGPLMGI